MKRETSILSGVLGEGVPNESSGFCNTKTAEPRIAKVDQVQDHEHEQDYPGTEPAGSGTPAAAGSLEAFP